MNELKWRHIRCIYEPFHKNKKTKEHQTNSTRRKASLLFENRALPYAESKFVDISKFNREHKFLSSTADV